MSKDTSFKLDVMIANLCPEGVEYSALREIVLSIKTGLNRRQNFQLNTADAQNYYCTVKEML